MAHGIINIDGVRISITRRGRDDMDIYIDDRKFCFYCEILLKDRSDPRSRDGVAVELSHPMDENGNSIKLDQKDLDLIKKALELEYDMPEYHVVFE